MKSPRHSYNTDHLYHINDLTLKFVAQEIIAALGDVEDGQVLTLKLTGVLQDGQAADHYRTRQKCAEW